MDQIYSAKEIDDLAGPGFRNLDWLPQLDAQNAEVLISKELCELVETLFCRADLGIQTARQSLGRGLAVGMVLGSKLALGRGEVGELFRMFRIEGEK